MADAQHHINEAERLLQPSVEMSPAEWGAVATKAHAHAAVAQAKILKDLLGKIR